MAIQKGFGAAQEAVEQAQKNNQGNPEFEKFSLKQDEPAKRVRFLVLDGDDSVTTFTEHWTEMNNTWKRNFACPNNGPQDTNCVVCAGKKGVDFVNDQRKSAHMIQLIDREDGKVKVWKFSPMAMSVLLEILKTNGNISDRDYTIQFVANDGVNKDENIKAKFMYIILPAEGPRDLTDAEKALPRYNLTELAPPYNAENLERIMAMKPGEGGKAAGGTKPAAKAADFLSALGAATGGANMAVDMFKNLNSTTANAPTATETPAATAPTAAAPAAAPAATTEAASAPEASASATDDFMKLLEDMK